MRNKISDMAKHINKKTLLILHIPHASLRLPKKFYSRCTIEKEKIKAFNQKMCDLYTDKLFSFRRFKCIRAKYSRIYCDVEKYEDDKRECMAKYGMGVIYTRTNLSEEFFIPTSTYRECVINSYYRRYHKRLSDFVSRYLNKGYRILFLDCHSFSEEIVMGAKMDVFPDICIGINEENGLNSQAANISEYFKKCGYSTAINKPYVGALVPNMLPQFCGERFVSVMIEVNRKLYLNDTQKSKNFGKIKKEIYKLLKMLKTNK